jgi:hypothetical protein
MYCARAAAPPKGRAVALSERLLPKQYTVRHFSPTAAITHERRAQHS